MNPEKTHAAARAPRSGNEMIRKEPTLSGIEYYKCNISLVTNINPLLYANLARDFSLQSRIGP